MRQLVSCLFCLLLAACAAAPVRARQVGLSLAEAQAVVADFEKTLAKWEVAEPLREPKSVDDVLEILKKDQVDLFPAGVEFAQAQTDVRARALQSQIELAWGEAQLDLAQLFSRVARHQREQLERLESKKAAGELTDDDQKTMHDLSAELAKDTTLSEALPVLAAEHVAAGAAVARDLIATKPDDYLGYRLAADYYRLRGSWAEFDQMVAKLEATNAKSNGLLFLRALSEIERFGHLEEGRALLQRALANDPKFVRAQSALVRTAATLEEKFLALEALERRSPRHQVVIWVGPSIRLSYEALKRARNGRSPRSPPR